MYNQYFIQYRCYLSPARQITLIVLLQIAMTVACSSHGEDDEVQEGYVQKSDSLEKEEETCKSGIGVLLNFDSPTPGDIEVSWETSEYSSQKVYSDCQGTQIDDVNFTKKDFSVYLEDKRYGLNVAKSFSMTLADCKSGQTLVKLPQQSIQLGSAKSCRFYMNVINIKLDLPKKAQIK